MSRIARHETSLIRGVVKECFKIILQPTCCLCDGFTDGRLLCGHCHVPTEIRGPVCARCGEEMPIASEACGLCLDSTREEFSGIRSHLWLTEKDLSILSGWKYRKKKHWLYAYQVDWRQTMGVFPQSVSLVPVPITLKKFFQRGFNQAELLARKISSATGLPLESHRLQKLRETPSQASSSRDQRRRNLRGAFEWVGKSGPPRDVLLIDDVWTTGSTLYACLKTLKAAGTQNVWAWTLFRTPAYWKRGDLQAVPSLALS